MQMKKYHIALAEPHGVRSRDPGGRILGSVRTLVPLHSQPLVAGILKRNETLYSLASIEIYNPKTAEPTHEEAYKAQQYGGRTLTHCRVGESLFSEGFSEMAKRIDVLGITVNFTQLSANAIEMARAARAINPRIKVVAGGSDAFYRYEYYLSTGYFDAIAPKDSEKVADRLILALLGENKEKLQGIPGIAYRDGNAIRKNPPTFEIDNVDKIRSRPLPAFELVKGQIGKWSEDDEGPLPNGIRPPLAYVEFAVGCHESCPFCTIAGTTYSFMENEQVKEYARHLKAHGFSTILDIADNTLTQLLVKKGRVERGKSGRQLLIERYSFLHDSGFRWDFGNGLQLSLFRAPDGKIDTELINAMFSGAFALYAPIEDPAEASYPKLRGWPVARKNDSRNPQQVFEDNLAILEYIASLGLPRMTVGIIIGYPNETNERLEKFTDALLHLKGRLKDANPGIEILFTPFLHEPLPGSADFSNCRQMMKYSIVEHPELMQYGLTVYGKGEMNEWDLVEARLDMIRTLNGEKALQSWLKTGDYPKADE